MEVNGKCYPLWGQFVEKQKEWIGGKLQDFGDSMCGGLAETTITGITLQPNVDKSAFFSVEGKDFGCGFDVKCGGIDCNSQQKDGWLVFHGYGGHKWRIQKPVKKVE